MPLIVLVTQLGLEETRQTPSRRIQQQWGATPRGRYRARHMVERSIVAHNARLDWAATMYYRFIIGILIRYGYGYSEKVAVSCAQVVPPSSLYHKPPHLLAELTAQSLTPSSRPG